MKTSELAFNNPLKIVGRGTFGLVFLTDCQGMQLAVKRVIPPCDRTKSKNKVEWNRPRLRNTTAANTPHHDGCRHHRCPPSSQPNRVRSASWIEETPTKTIGCAASVLASYVRLMWWLRHSGGVINNPPPPNHQRLPAHDGTTMVVASPPVLPSPATDDDDGGMTEEERKEGRIFFVPPPLPRPTPMAVRGSNMPPLNCACPMI